MRNHVNTHTVSGNLGADAEAQALQYPVDGQKLVRFKMRIGCDKMVRRPNGPAKRTTWFTIRFDVRPAAVKYFQTHLKKGAEILAVGEQLVDEIKDDLGDRYYHFMAAHSVTVVVEAKSEPVVKDVAPAPVPVSAPARPQLAAVRATPAPRPARTSALRSAQPGLETPATAGGRQHALDEAELQQAVTW